MAAEGEPATPWAVGRPGGEDAGVAFLAPLDPLAWDRDLLLRLWAFDYRWEVYVPAAKRRWGYYVLPLLYGDRFVGRIEPRIDRKTGTLRVLAARELDRQDLAAALQADDLEVLLGYAPASPGLRQVSGPGGQPRRRHRDAAVRARLGPRGRLLASPS